MYGHRLVWELPASLYTMRPFGGRPAQTLSRFVARRSGAIFIAIVILLFVRAGFYAGHNHPDSTLYHALKKPPSETRWLAKPSNSDNLAHHPIPQLMEDAEAQFKKKLKSQSKTLKAAVTEYRRRYKRDPPKGFDQWFKFAQQNDVRMTDEYDGLVRDLEPFWDLPGKELRRRSRQVLC